MLLAAVLAVSLEAVLVLVPAVLLQQPPASSTETTSSATVGSCLSAETVGDEGVLGTIVGFVLSGNVGSSCSGWADSDMYVGDVGGRIGRGRRRTFSVSFFSAQDCAAFPTWPCSRLDKLGQTQ